MTPKEFDKKWWGLIPDAEQKEWEADIQSLKSPTDLKMLNEASMAGFQQGMKFENERWTEKIQKCINFWNETEGMGGLVAELSKLLEGEK